jgi:hypothetical protein
MPCAWSTLALLAFLGTGSAAPQAQARFSFAVVGHVRGPANGELPRERLQRLIEDVRRAGPDLVVLTGDSIYGDIDRQWDEERTPLDREALVADWEALDALLATLEVPVHRAPGNHDLWERTTLEVWRERYGEPHRWFDFEGARFLILNSCWLPPEGSDERLPGRFIRGFQLPPEQVEWLAGALAAAPAPEHVFGFMGHTLWWEDDAAWWREVHPLLARAPTRAVFAGDLGPNKWAHLERDGIHYVQSAVEFTDPALRMLQNREESRRINAELDNWVLVHVDGPEVRYEVRALGALSEPRHGPEHHRAVHEHDAGSVPRKLFDRFHTPQKLFDGLLMAGTLGLGGGLLIGIALAVLFRRRRAT